MRNQFLKFVPSVLILAALALLFIPKAVSFLDVEKFFSSTDAHYQPADRDLFHKSLVHREDYYYPGVSIGKLWKKLDIGAAVAGREHHHFALRDEYLFGCGFANYSACILPYPVVKEYELGEYRALQVSSSSLRFPDYQYLLFKYEQKTWAYFGHIDVFDNKKGEPVFKLLDNGFASVVSLAGAGEGYSTRFMQVYHFDGKAVNLVLAVPIEASRKRLGLLDFDVTGAYDYANGVLTGTYKVTFGAQELINGLPVRSLPLFAVSRRLTLFWNGAALVYDADRSDITPADLTWIVTGSYARVYKMFRSDFDKLQKAAGVKKEWFKEFLSVVKEEGGVAEGALSAPPSRSQRH